MSSLLSKLHTPLSQTLLLVPPKHSTEDLMATSEGEEEEEETREAATALLERRGRESCLPPASIASPMGLKLPQLREVPGPG